jgi:SAM-dependent methyltransferase
VRVNDAPGCEESTVSDDQRRQEEASRVTAEREEADQRYRVALEAADRAVPTFRPVAPAARGEGQGAAGLNPLWEVMHEPGGASLVGRIKTLLRKVFRMPLSGMLRRQQTFNGSVVSYAASVDAALSELGEQMQAIARFHHFVIQFMQQVWPLVDTNHRHQLMVGSGLAAYLEEINSVSAMRWEALQTKDRRTIAALDEIRTSVATVQQTGAVLKRELERMLAAGPVLVPGVESIQPPSGAGAPAHPTNATPTVRSAANPDAVNAYKYVGFEHKFRGSEDDIAERLAGYLPLFDGANAVLDVGCGRGEFLAALRDRGVAGRGLDINHEMVEMCRTRGLSVDEGDALAYLERQADGSLGGLFAAQVVEHFQPGYLVRLLDVAFHALRPGSRVVLETVNPACWSAFFDSYIRDITHVWPLHPETLSYLVTAAGFQRVEIRYMSPYSPDHKLQRVAVARDTPLTPIEALTIETLNLNVDRLNGQLFSHRDYAVIAERP